jgi:RNA polymerase sigma-70 factor (ECF subfamily)
MIRAIPSSGMSSSEPEPMESVAEPDDALLARVAEGDRHAFEVLYRRYYPRLYGFLLRLTRRPEVAEEAINDTLFVVWRKAAEFAGASRVSTWIFGIAYRKGLKGLARLERRRDDDAEGGPAAGREPIAPGGPGHDLDAGELARELGAALVQLPPEQRAVVEMTYFQDLPYREIAAMMDCPVNTVKTRMFHARRRLRELLPALGRRRDTDREEGRR